MFGKYPILNVFTPYAGLFLSKCKNELDDVSVADNNIIVVTNMGIIVIGFRCFLANVVPFISLILSIWKLYMTPGKYAINVNWVQILM